MKPEVNLGLPEHHSLRTIAFAAGAAIVTALLVRYRDEILDSVNYAIETSADLNPNSH